MSTLHEAIVGICDPGIRDTVRKLLDAGFDTTDSGDGVSKPADARAFDVPHVICRVHSVMMVGESYRMMSVLGPGWHVEAVYFPAEDVAILQATREGA